jgi:hypothetical protein
MATAVRQRDLYAADGSLTSSTTDNPFGNFGETGFMIDHVTPGYKRLSNSGSIINSPMFRSVCVRSLPNQLAKIMNSNGTRWEWSGTNTGFTANPFIQPAADHFMGNALDAGVDAGRALNSALLKAFANVSKADTLILVTAAEAHKTIGTIIGTAGGLMGGIKSLMQGSPKKAVLKALLGQSYKEQKRHGKAWGSKSLAKKWLEVRYGWVPMLYDLEGSLAALNRIRYPRFTARGFSRETGVKTTTGNTSIDPTFGHSVNWKVTEEYTEEYRAYVLYSVKEDWFKAHKLGALSLGQTAWELVPFSFVIDWFVDIGEWLAAIEPRAGITYLCHGVVRRGSYEKKGLITGTISDSGSSLPGWLGQADLYKTSMKQRITSLDAPLRPSIDVRLNVKRGIDSIALFVQQASKLR